MARKLTITNSIRSLRFFAGEMTQLELAEKAGASRQTIVALEAGKYTPSLELAFRIADVFGVPIGEVFQCTAEEENQKRIRKQ
ncbi:helix-turn-helix transcriptional regulator [Breznakiella homolactica]|uniref:Helix-turn-helix transcriptional regulator n=1 Tax=Breznakiella homolactica TaxID=2798577 RepID=A0A7T7XMN3_9SPIR|nr:helix-turn-helix transcriptional regulator [Breznakiella homolactica]QQO09165.1 helix-turn-helix transcriptional regulator [Breznakiella homolactica]